MDNVNDLIGKLSDDLQPVKRRSPYLSALLWGSIALIYIVGVIIYYGLTVNLSESLQTASFLFEMSLSLMIFIFAALGSSFLSYPDGMQNTWVKNTALCLFLVFIGWIMANVIEEGFDRSIFYAQSCYKGIFVESLPFVALILLTMRGHSTQPYWLMAMNIFAVTAIGWIALRVTCAMHESMLYSFTHYFLPFAVLSVAVGVFARKIFKW